jgi:hypothetical protein
MKIKTNEKSREAVHKRQLVITKACGKSKLLWTNLVIKLGATIEVVLKDV